MLELSDIMLSEYMNRLRSCLNDSYTNDRVSTRDCYGTLRSRSYYPVDACIARPPLKTSSHLQGTFCLDTDKL